MSWPRPRVAVLVVIAITSVLAISAVVVLARPSPSRCTDIELRGRAREVNVSVGALPGWLTDTRFFWVCRHALSDGSTVDSYIGHYDDEPWIGGYPGLEAVAPGMSPDEVRAVLGEPSRVATKQAPSENLFGQGETERVIQFGWIYSLDGWDGGIEVYFDSTERVVDTNWGNP